MSNLEENLSAKIPSGETLKPWITLGLFNQDVNDTVRGLTLFETQSTTVGATMLQQAAEAGLALLQEPAAEGDSADFRGEEQRWSLVRRPEKLLQWGKYNIANHLGAVLLQSILTADQPGAVTFTLGSGMNCLAQVLVNGQLVYSGIIGKKRGDEYTFTAFLQAGENRLAVGLYRVGRFAQLGFRLTLDRDVQVSAPLPTGMTIDERLTIEREVVAFRLERDVFYPGMALGPICEVTPSRAPRVQLWPGVPSTARHLRQNPHTAPLAEVSASEAGLVTLAQAVDLPDGPYKIAIDWLDESGQPLTGLLYHVHKFTPAPELPGPQNQETRRLRVLEHYTTSVEWQLTWNQICRYALGRYDQIDADAIRASCEHVIQRKDCADFMIQGILRLLYWDRDQHKLDPALVALMKEAVLGFKYWVDEPGDTVMYMGSENHRLLFHVAEWMAGQLYPIEEFSNSGMRGLYHSTKGRMYITEWIRQRGRFGLDEWHSNSYYPITIAPLVNVYDFAINEDSKLREMAGFALDYMLFNIASDSYQGVFGSSHGRSYGEYVKYPDMEMTAGISWLYWGLGSLIPGTEGMGVVCLATSSYQPPALLNGMANDNTQTIKSLEKHGLLGRGARHACQVVYRTPDYMLASVQDHRKGEFEASTHPAQVTLGNKNIIFWTCPLTSGEGHGLRPDYWSGNAVLPRVLQISNVMALHWRRQPLTWMTHCWFEKDRFDAYKLDIPGKNGGTWAFCQVNDGYVGIYSQNGYELGTLTQYAGRELICYAEENTWLVECGRKADWGSFDAFCDALAAAPVTFENDVMTYQSPSQGIIISGWEQNPIHNGAPVDSSAFPLVRNLWAYSDYGSGEITLTYGNERQQLWFNQ